MDTSINAITIIFTVHLLAKLHASLTFGLAASGSLLQLNFANLTIYPNMHLEFLRNSKENNLPALSEVLELLFL
jgi:hypothetical protein